MAGLLAAGATVLAPATPAAAAGTVTLTGLGVPYTETFDSLASTGTSSTTPAGWEFAEAGTNANATYTAGTGSGNGGDTYSFGAAGSTDRAFGGLLSGSLTPTIGAGLVNGTGGTITSLRVSFTGEQWRLGAAGRVDRLDAQFSTDATSLTSGTWTDVDALDATSPVTVGAAAALDGNASANRVAVSAAIAGLSVVPGGSIWLRWNDFNASSSDDGLAIDDVSIIPDGFAGVEEAPAVAATVPAAGATGVPANQSVTVSFTEAVTVTDPWFSLDCATSGAHPAAVTGGPTSFTLDPATDFTFGETCTLTIDPTKVSDVDGNDPPDTMTFAFTAGFSVQTDPCAAPFTPAYAIQGSGATAAVTGAVTTQGVVVGDYEYPGSGSTGSFLRGFYLQDATGDGDAATSDAVFVFNGNANGVAVGDVVRVTGTAAEFQEQTQVSASSVVRCGTTGTVAPTDVVFPVASATALEAVEGMLVRLPQEMSVTEHFQLGRFGQVLLSAGGRLQQPTNMVAPGAPALALQVSNDLRKILLDDELQSQNPDPIRFARGGQPLSASNTLRGGDTATGIVGVMTYTWAGNNASPNAYRVRPIGALGGTVNFVAANARPAVSPAVGGSVRVVGMNLLNYFNTFDGLPDTVDNCTNGVGGPATDCRGADTAAEFARQTPKTVAAILALNPDVLGVNELENDGYGPDSALAYLVDQLNAATAPGTYAYVDVDTNTGQTNAMGSDAIRVAQIYKPAVVTPTGRTAVLNSVEFVNGGDAAPRARPSLAQAYAVTATGAVFVVDVNHFKSKGSACDVADAGDGQGNCNVVRTNGARALTSWLATDPTGTGDPDVLLVGDYNSYAQEDPIKVIEGAGYTNLIADRLGPAAYSYVFDGQWGYLDHAFATASMGTQVVGIADHHINADEPSVLDYNTDFKTANLIGTLYAPDQFRVSDHDPVVIGLNPNAAPTVSAGPFAVDEGGSVVLSATAADPNGDGLTYAWDLDGDGSFETVGQAPTFSAASIDGPATRPVSVRVTDGGGLSATATTAVTVANVAPTVTATFVRPASVCGRNNASLTVTLGDAAPADAVSAVVTWGDGTSESITGTGTRALTHTYARAGRYTATVTATDDDGGSSTATATVSIAYITSGIVAPILGDVKAGRTVPLAIGYLDCTLRVPADLAPTVTVRTAGGVTVLTDAMRFVGGVYTFSLDTRRLPDPSGRYVVTVTVPTTGQTSTLAFRLRP